MADYIKLGISSSKMERMRSAKSIEIIKKNTDKYIDVIELNELELDGFDLAVLNRAFRSGTINAALIDLEKLMEADRQGLCLEEGVAVAGIMKRRDPRQVVITKRRKSEIVPDARIVTKRGEDTEQILSLYDNISCREEDSISGMFKLLTCDLCDAIIIPADDIKTVRKHKMYEYRYNYLDCKDYVPPCGRAVYALLVSDKDLIGLAREVSDVNTSRCFSIEKDILDRLGALAYLRNCKVFVSIDKSRISACAYVSNDKGYIRVEEKESIVYKNLVVRKLVDRITEKM